MLKKLLPILFITSILCTCASSAQNMIYAENIPRESFFLIHRVMKMHSCKNKEMCSIVDRSSYGSGAAIDKNKSGVFILTAAHVCVSSLAMEKDVLSTKFLVTSLYGDENSAEVLSYDKPLDVCVLYAKGVDVKTIPMSKTKPKPGEKLYNTAAPLVIFAADAVPILEGRYIGVGNHNYAMYSIPAAPGSSGSPIINHKGQLVGMIHSVYRRFPMISLSVQYEDLKDFLEEVKSKYHLYGTCGCILDKALNLFKY